MPAREERPGLIAARLIAALALGVAALMVLRPFLVPITWAAIVAYVTWPLYRVVRRRSGRPRVAAALFTLAAALVASIPVAGLLVALAQEATQLVEALQGWVARGAPVPEWIASSPWLADSVEWLRSHAVPESLAVGDWAQRYGTRFSSGLAKVASGIARNMMEFAVMLMTLYVFYVEGERIVETTRRLSAVLFPSAPAQFMEQIGAAIRGVVFGLLGTALVQGILAGSAFALVGIPSPVALGAATAALALVPAGPSLLGLGAVVWLLAHDRLGAAIGIGLWMLLVVASVDNVLRPLLISGPARISFLLVFFGVLGGLAWLGLLGIFVGPVLLSVAFALLVEFSWRHSPQPRSR